MFWNSTIGPIHWIYIPEILTDAQFGPVLTVHYMNGIEISLCTEYMMYYLKPFGTFLFFATVTFVGGIFMVIFVKETKGLNDKEKKSLYQKHVNIPVEMETLNPIEVIELDEIKIVESI
jgi:hypothetical protein